MTIVNQSRTSGLYKVNSLNERSIISFGLHLSSFAKANISPTVTKIHKSIQSINSSL